MRSGRTRLLAKLLVSLVLLAVVVTAAGPRQILEVLAGVDRLGFALALAIGLVGIVLSTKRWQLLLASKREHISFARIFKIYYVGAFSNLFLPSSIGGDVVKSAIMARSTSENVAAYSSVIVNRFCGLFALVTLGVGAVFVRPDLVTPRVAEIVGFIGIGAVVAPLVLLAARRSIRRYDRVATVLGVDWYTHVERFLTSIEQYRDVPSALAMVLALSFVFQASVVVTHYVIAHAVGLRLPLAYLFIVVPLIELLLLVPISIHGHGVREGLFVLFYTPMGVSPSEAVGFSITLAVMVFVMYSFGSLFVATDLYGTSTNQEDWR